MKKLSFILPCYNVERYVADCLDSIYAQDLPEDEYEVICVNDCSTDGTREVIEDYAVLHPNLTLIDHTENLTAGGARNTGIKSAKGEYIWFVDPDDMIKPNCLHELCFSTMSKAIDVLMFNFSIVDVHFNPIQNRNVFFQDGETLSGQDFVIIYTPGKFSAHCMVWRCLFRTAFLREKNLYYPIMRKAEDVSFLWKVLLYADRVGSVGDVYYVYKSNPDSVANKKYDSHVFFSERILFGNEIVAMLKNRDIEIRLSIREDMLKTLKWCANSSLNTLFVMSKEELGKYYDEIVLNREAVENLKPFMNRKNKFLYSTFGGRLIWLGKFCLLKLMFGKN